MELFKAHNKLDEAVARALFPEFDDVPYAD